MHLLSLSHSHFSPAGRADVVLPRVAVLLAEARADEGGLARARLPQGQGLRRRQGAGRHEGLAGDRGADRNSLRKV